VAAQVINTQAQWQSVRSYPKVHMNVILVFRTYYGVKETGLCLFLPSSH
jgi:hypothetical protein